MSFTDAVSTPSPGYFVVSIYPAARRNRIEIYGVPFYQNAGNDLPAIQGETLTNNCDCFADQVQYGLAGASGQYVSTSFSHSAFVSGNVTYLPARARTGTMITLINNGATACTVGGGSPSNIAGVTNLVAGQTVNMVKGANGSWFPSTVF